MILSPTDKHDIDDLAESLAHEGKRRAASIYHAWANQRGWWMQLEWIPARERFRETHRAARAAWAGGGAPIRQNPPQRPYSRFYGHGEAQT